MALFGAIAGVVAAVAATGAKTVNDRVQEFRNATTKR